MSGAFEYLPTSNIHLGTQSEITDFSTDMFSGTHSDTSTRIIFDSDTPFHRALHGSRYDLPSSIRSTPGIPSPSSRRPMFSLNTGMVNSRRHFSQSLKCRGRFVLEMIRLNYRMLISLTLTLFVAIFVNFLNPSNVDVWISVNSLLFQQSIYKLENSGEQIAKWMECIKIGNTTDECSLMALELLPLTLWRNVTADTARASFGTIFFIVEITKGYHNPTPKNTVAKLSSGTFGER